MNPLIYALIVEVIMLILVIICIVRDTIITDRLIREMTE